MSGSNDALTQFMLMQARQQQRQPSTQARLAQQMMAQNAAMANQPSFGAGPAIARVGSNILAGFMSGMAERSDREREDAQLQQMQDRQDKAQFRQGEEAANFARTHRLPGAPPLPAPQLAEGEAPPPQAPQQPPDWRAAALAGFGSNNPAIHRQAQAALSIGQMEDQQAARLEQARLARELAVASRAPRAPEPMVVVQTPEGPRYVPQSQAVGREPARVQQPGTGGIFAGTGMDAQSMNLLLRGDSATPEYALAFNQLFGPRTVTNADGSIVTIQPQAPQGIRPPGAPAAQAASPGMPAAPPEAAASPPVAPGAPTTTTTQTPGGTVTRTTGRDATLSEAQSRSNMFGLAMSEGQRILEEVQTPSVAAIMAWRNMPEGGVNLGLNENDQMYFNAVRQFAAGVLRKETGAAFGANELLDVQSRFFPMPGDSVNVMRQKARARQQAIAAMQAEIPGGFRGQIAPPSPPATPTAPPGAPPRQPGMQDRPRIRNQQQGTQNLPPGFEVIQ